MWSRADGDAAAEAVGEGDRKGVATVEDSPGGGVLGSAGGLTESRSPTSGRAGAAPKTALWRTGRAPNHTSSTASRVAPDHTITYVITRRIHAMVPLRVRNMANVLVVEDDQFVRSAMIRELSARSHTVRSASTALDALREVAQSAPDVVVLDLGLPDLDGSEALKMLRAVSDVPVIVATARDDETEVVRLLNAGADDYLVKPFSPEHLMARLAAVLRRSRQATAPPQICQVGGVRVDLGGREAELDGVPLALPRREFDLLAHLAFRPGQVVSRRELLAEVWRQSYGDDQTIDVHLSWLRRKLGETASKPRYLHTVRGVGVKLVAPE